MTKSEAFDVVIVGARCSGSSLATLLARRGLKVCVLDRARFPSEVLSTHVIWPTGVVVLDNLGVLDAVRASGPIPLTKFTLVHEDARVDADLSDGVEGTRGPGLCVRRVTLDQLLVDAAASAGAEVLTETKVRALIQENGRVVGVETDRGSFRGKLVVGADGIRSTVANLAGAREYHLIPPSRLFTWAYFEGVGDTEGRLRVARLGEWVFFSSPTDAGLYLVAVSPEISNKDRFLADRERNFIAALRVWPELSNLVSGARRYGSIRVMANWHGYFREAAGPGWVLLGDSGHFTDPTGAQGMSDAFRHATALSDAIALGLRDTQVVDHELHRWWRWRDRDLYEMHWWAADLGREGPTSRLGVQVTRQIARDPEDREKLIRLLNHDLRPSQLFNESRVNGALAHAARECPDQLPLMLKELTTELGTYARRARERQDPPVTDAITLPAYG